MSNLLKDRYPELLKEWDYEKNDLLPNQVTFGASKKVWWICKERHSFEQSINKRTTRNFSCPYCSNQKVGYGNDLKTTHPNLAREWDYEKNDLLPNQVTFGSRKKVWWVCKERHSFEASIGQRTNRKNNCPYCANKKVGYGNDLKTTHPNLAREWDYEKNDLLPNQVTFGSRKKVWWICNNAHSYSSQVDSRTRKKSRGCPYCVNKKVGYGNDLKTTHPELIKEWDFEKNQISPEFLTAGTSSKAWWVCKKGHSYFTNIRTRTKANSGCPYCSNQKVGYGNDLKKTYPELIKEWDFEKNQISPDEVTSQSAKKVWWVCKQGHSWFAKISTRTPSKVGNNKGSGCPYCTNILVSKTNNLKHLYPELIKEWDFEKNQISQDEVTSQSAKKVWWVCKQGHSWSAVIYSRTPSKVGKYKGNSCPYCTLTPRSREEVFVLFELKQFFNIDANDHKIKLKRVEDVDIKLANEKVVIEYDGAYWHKDKAERDKAKTKALEKAGWTVVRVREKPLKVLSRKYNVSSKTGEYKETANKVLKKLNQLGYEVKGLDKYLERKTLVNKKEAEKYIDKLLKEKKKK